MKILANIILGLSIGLLMPALALAQNQEAALGVAISPAISEFAGDPGDTIEGTVLFGNTTNNPLAATLETNSLIPIDDIIDQARRSEFDASSWIELGTKDLVFDANDQHIVPFTITIPEDAAPGGHYAMITLKPGIIQQEVTDTIIAPNVQASIFITVSGDINERLEIIESDFQFNRLTQSKENDITFRLRNTGNVHVLPSPRITLYKDGEFLQRYPLQQQLILPNTEKDFVFTWDTDVSVGQYEMRVELTYGNESTPLASGEHTFWVIPDVLRIFLFVSLLCGLGYLLIKRKNIPRFVSVLRGHAHYTGKTYKKDAGPEDLPDPDKKTQSVKEVAQEIDQSPEILGWPEYEDTISSEDTLEEVSTIPSNEPRIAIDSRPVIEATVEVKRPEILSQTKVTSHDSTTLITQTSASTIVREKSPFFDPEQEAIKEIEAKPQEPTEEEPETKPSNKKPTPKKKTRKTAAKKTTKKTTKKPAKKKNATKKPQTAKPTAKKTRAKKTTVKTAAKGTTTKKKPTKAKKKVAKKTTKTTKSKVTTNKTAKKSSTGSKKNKG